MLKPTRRASLPNFATKRGFAAGGAIGVEVLEATTVRLSVGPTIAHHDVQLLLTLVRGRLRVRGGAGSRLC